MTDSTVESPIDFGARYTAPGFRGVALAPIRYATKSAPITNTVTVCANCDDTVYEDDNGAGGTIWVHDFGSTVCHDNPPGSGEDGDTTTVAEPGREVEDETGEFEDVDDREWIICIMVGDDTEQLIETDTLVKIDDNDYCHECGQIGCGHDGRDRS